MRLRELNSTNRLGGNLIYCNREKEMNGQSDLFKIIVIGECEWAQWQNLNYFILIIIVVLWFAVLSRTWKSMIVIYTWHCKNLLRIRFDETTNLKSRHWKKWTTLMNCTHLVCFNPLSRKTWCTMEDETILVICCCTFCSHYFDMRKRELADRESEGEMLFLPLPWSIHASIWKKVLLYDSDEEANEQMY